MKWSTKILSYTHTAPRPPTSYNQIGQHVQWCAALQS